MLLHQNLRLSRILRITWKVDLLMIVSGTLAYWTEVHVLKDYVTIPASLPSLLGTAIAFFIGFNNNQAYSRWWEARTIWGGLVNDSRSWARNVLYYSTQNNLDLKDDHAPLDRDTLPRRMVLRHIGFVYALKKALRGSDEQTYLEYLTTHDAEQLLKYSNQPSALLDQQARDLNRLRDTGQIDGYKFLTLNELIVRFSDRMGASERIKNTIFPPTYVYFTRLFIWLFVILLTLSIADNTGMWSIGFSWLIGFVFHVTHINGLSLMNPFETNPASISLDSISRTIEINLLQTLREQTIPEPVQAINGEYIL